MKCSVLQSGPAVIAAALIPALGCTPAAAEPSRFYVQDPPQLSCVIAQDFKAGSFISHKTLDRLRFGLRQCSMQAGKLDEVQNWVNLSLIFYSGWEYFWRTGGHKLGWAAGTGDTGAAVTTNVVTQTTLGYFAVVPVMLGDLTEYRSRDRLHAGAVAALLSLSDRYQALTSTLAAARVKAKGMTFAGADGGESDVAKLCYALDGKRNASAKTSTAGKTADEKVRKRCSDLMDASDEIVSWRGQLDNVGDKDIEKTIAQNYAYDALNVLLKVDAVDRSLDIPPGKAFGTMIAAPFSAVADMLRGGERKSPFQPAPDEISANVPVNIKSFALKKATTTAISTDGRIALLAADYCGAPPPPPSGTTSAQNNGSNCADDLRTLDSEVFSVNSAREYLARFQNLNDQAVVNIDMTAPKVVFTSVGSQPAATPSTPTMPTPPSTSTTTTTGGAATTGAS